MNVILWWSVVVLVGREVASYFHQPICNPTLGYCAEFFNTTKLPNKFSETDFSRVVGEYCPNFPYLVLVSCFVNRFQ